MTFSTFQKSVHVDEFHRCVYTLLYFLVCLSTFHSKYGIAKVVYRCNAHTRRAKLLTLSVILSVCARARINVGRFLLHTVFAKKKKKLFPITRDRIETPRLASCVYARALSGPAIAQRRTSSHLPTVLLHFCIVLFHISCVEAARSNTIECTQPYSFITLLYMCYGNQKFNVTTTQ